MVKPGSQSSALVEYVDFLPTFVEVAGGKPNPRLDGKSLLPVLLDQTDQHKSHVFGIMTTRGIINGSDVYPIRTVRDDRYRLIWNLNPSATFTNALTKSPMFESMNQLALSGDPTAKWVVANYQHRPEWELYDCQQDPLEMKNLADDPRYESVRNRLQQKLDAWMKSQGDRGIQTEIDAALRLQKNSGKSREQALQAWKRQHDKASKRPDTKERQKKRGGKNRSPNK